MIFITLGTQDKEFNRLVNEVDCLITKGIIKEEVIMQTGITKYKGKNKNVKTIDFTNIDEFNKYIKDANYIITHGGVGTILDSLKLGKKVIAVPRLSKYAEHENDHQLQIVEKFDKEGYIIGKLEENSLEDCIERLKKFKPKKYIGGNDLMISLIDNFIENI